MTQEEFDNQSIFVDAVETSSAPPETVLSAEEQAKVNKVQSKRKMIILVGILSLGLMVILAVWSTKFLKPTMETAVGPTATPIPGKNFTSTEIELTRLENAVKLANPSENTLAPPPVNETLSL